MTKKNNKPSEYNGHTTLHTAQLRGLAILVSRATRVICALRFADHVTKRNGGSGD